ncbi:hypothetical protein [Agrococcus lahaulensis]|uniref:hypothetical protein n=1 Tax=Agrococcus lahaulensis TaxID=341722 RepID=UPI00047CCBEE|nr:hypothetical protein [Agrococcus lahaulensis]
MTQHEAAGDGMLRARYGRRDPAANEFTAGDIAFGWVVGVGAVLAGSFVFGAVLAAAVLPIALLYGAIIGLPALTLYGVPVALAAATALRRAPSEWVHHAVFGVLGALGGALAVAIFANGDPNWSVLFAPGIITGAASAVLARGLAKRRALRTRGAEPAAAG